MYRMTHACLHCVSHSTLSAQTARKQAQAPSQLPAGYLTLVQGNEHHAIVTRPNLTLRA